MEKKKKKKIKQKLKLQIPAGKATPAPPVGPTLGQAGIKIMDFCKAFNEKTRELGGYIIPVEIYIYPDNSFDFITKTPPASDYLKKAANIESGSGEPNKKKVATITKKQVKEIAENKLKDLNTNDIEQAMRIIEGTARSMGIEVRK